MIRNWLYIFLYHIKNNKLFTALNILGLSIGMASLIFAILYWSDEHSYDKWNPEVENIYQVTSIVRESETWASVVAPLESYIEEMPEVEKHFFSYSWYNNDIVEQKGKNIMIEKVVNAQKDFFHLFPFTFIKGNASDALKDINSIALSEATAKQLFGKENPMNKSVKYADENYIVRGIYTIPGKSSFSPNAVISSIYKEIENQKDRWGNFNFSLYLKINNPKDVTTVVKKMNDALYENRIVKEAEKSGITPEELIKKYGQITVKLEPLKTARLHSKVRGYPEGKGNYQLLLIMMGLSLLILTLSVVNYINLATAGAIKRAKEVGVRKITGATKSNIVWQFIFETLIISLFSILIAVSIVELSLPYYNDFLDKTLVMKGQQFYTQLIIILGIMILVAGVFPAIYISNFKTINVLKGNFSRSKSGIWLRNGMLVLQFAIASFFIVGSYIVNQQINHLTNKELGFNGDQVIVINYNKDRRKPNESFGSYTQRIYAPIVTLKQELQKIKGVQQVSTGAFNFARGASSSSSFVYNDVNIQGRNMAVDFDMLPMMKIEMKEGRYLQEKFASDTVSNILINETSQRMMKEENPLEKEINWNGKKLKIVGVVKDFNFRGPHNKVPPMVFFHLRTIKWMTYNVNSISVKISPENMEETIANIEKFWTKEIDTKYPFDYEFLNKEFARTYEDYVKQKNIFSLLNAVVILIALFGLFALASYSIQRRMKGIAIRKTLGAETQTLLKELSKQYLIFCIIGFCIALFPAYYLLQKWLENFAYRIDISIVPFVIGFLALLALTLLVVLSRAYQATKVDVLKYLKYE